MRQAASPSRQPQRPPGTAQAGLPIRRGTPTSAVAAALYASTLTPPGSRSISPVGFSSARAGSPARTMSLMSNSSVATAATTATTSTATSTATTTTAAASAAAPAPLPGLPFTRSLLERPSTGHPCDPLHLVLKAFVPHVAVYASRDTDNMLRDKGFDNGLWELLRPFGEQVAGRVQVRDSNGAPRPWDDFAVRFVRFGDNIETPESAQGIIQPPTSPPPQLVNERWLRQRRQQRQRQRQQGRGRRRSDADGKTEKDAASVADSDDDDDDEDSSGTQYTTDSRNNATAARIPLVEAIVDKHLTYAESAFSGVPPTPAAAAAAALSPTSPMHHADPASTTTDPSGILDNTSPYYALYLRRLLSGLPVAAHETFAHPVACVIAISSHNPAPIQAFQELYRDISQGDRRMPPWVDDNFLRYYVLVHDEENGDIAQSMALFERMKRSLGLHCHLLRLRSSQCAESDDDSFLLPRCDWMTAVDEYADLTGGGGGEKESEDGDGDHDDDNDDDDDHAVPDRYIFESDATAIRTFVREMVTQSLVPTMERNVSLWNDQFASKRKGLSGRFMSLSKRWAGFGGGGSSSNSSSGGGLRNGGSGLTAGSSGSNYDAVHGFYGAEASEAVLRKLADYAFMLRDWKLAMSTYDILRGDYTSDKAWKHHAAANEMCALALLIMPPSLSSRTKLDTIGGMLEQAFYSYYTRCGSAYGAARVVLLGLELLRLRGGTPAVDDAVRWGMRLLDARLLGLVGDALLRERMAVCCATRIAPQAAVRDPRAGTSAATAPAAALFLGFGSWRRKSAFWSVLAAEAWVAQAKYIQAQRGLNEARQMYSMLQSDEGIDGFAQARAFMAGLQLQLKQGLADGAGVGGRGDDTNTTAAAAAAAGSRPTTPSPDATAAAAAAAAAPDTTGPALTAPGGETPDVEVEVEVELLADETSQKIAKRRSRRDSLLGGSGAGQAGLESAPLRRLAEQDSEEEAGHDAAGFGQV